MPPQNVLLLIADDLGKQLGCYGATTCHTPHLDALARSGTLFTRAFASTASCSASRSTIYTGLHTHQNGQYGLAGERHHFTTFGDVATAPKLLKERGYLTAVVGKVHVGPAEVYPWEVRMESDTRDVGWVAERVGEVFELAKGKKGGGEEEGRPFFLTVGFIDPHRDRTRAGFGNRGGPEEQAAVFSPEVEAARRQYDPADVEVPSFLSDLPGVRTEFASYYEAISRMDLGVGLILEQLQKSGLAEDTLVLFLSDNGPPFLNSKTTLYDAGVCLPLIVRAPGGKEGVVNPNMVSYVDILPTILDYTSAAAGGQQVGGEAEQDTRRQGRSFLRVLAAEHVVADADWAQEVYGSHTFHEITNYWPTRFVRTARFKYHRNIAWRLDFPFAADIYGSLTWEDIRDAERNPAKTVGSRPLRDYFFRPAEELYDLEADPLEVKNLATQEGGGGGEYAQVLSELREKVEAWQYRTLDPWLYRDGISVLFVKHHLEAGMQMPDRWDLDAENTGSRGDGGLAAFQQRAWGTDRVQD